MRNPLIEAEIQSRRLIFLPKMQYKQQRIIILLWPVRQLCKPVFFAGKRASKINTFYIDLNT
jgi:hypothetical protein